ncbi:Ribonuclease H-like protein [Mycena indigotica]|uniref:Ribonuclease H-like protein n=1 Tax=Mycena indigotica TaxID=2126181 RepID=A0A8H6W5W7_9AGAR|nr:Ribonuclease H-like protein [Mycena indigotica]KAF7303976.1 Ribonuclease H-like protein [Mycena indigotica]
MGLLQQKKSSKNFLSPVSRGLNGRLISSILTESGAVDSAGNCTIHDDDRGVHGHFGVLAALQSSIDTSWLSSLTVQFSLTTAEEMASLGTNTRRLTHVLEKTPSIRVLSLTLDIQSWQSCSSDHTGNVQHFGDEAFSAAFNELLSVIARLPHLQSLEINTPINVPVSLGPARLGPAIPHAAKSLFTRNNPITQPLDYRMNSAIVVLPAYFKSTLAFLSSRAISSLHIEMTLSPSDWSFLLQEIANILPQLPELTLIGVNVTKTQFTAVISRFRMLRTLKTDLGFLELSMAHVKLTHERERSLAPPSPSNWPKLSQLLPSASRKLSHLTAISARLEHLAALLGRVLLPALLEVDLDGCPQITPRSAQMMCKSLDLAVMDRPLWDSAVARFRECRIRQMDITSQGATALAKWLALFSRLTRVVFVDHDNLPFGFKSRLATEILHGSHVENIYFGQALWKRDVNQSKQQPHLLDFPDELLLLIFPYLNSELYSLSRLSKRLHFLALPEYFARHGISQPSLALNSALFITSIRDITCNFKLSQSMAWYLHDIERLRSFIARFPSVSAVALTLVDLEHLEAAAVNDKMRDLYRQQIGHLIDTILSKGCVDLSIRGAPLARPGGAEPIWSSETQEMHLSNETNSLSSFSFSHTSRLSRFGLRWMFSALRRSNISALTISAPRDSESELLTLVGALLPNLSELTITHGGDYFPATLLNLLNVLPLLEKLVLPRAWPAIDDATGLPAPELAHLKHLSAPPSVVLHLLGHSPRQPPANAPLPVLETLVLVLSEWHPFPEGWSAAGILSAVTHRTPPIDQPHKQLNIVLDVAYSTLQETFAWWDRIGGFSTDRDRDFPPIESLDLTERGVNSNADNQLRTRVVLAVVARLPSLRRMNMYKKVNFWFLASPLDWVTLGLAIAEHAPRIETITFNGTMVYS